MREASQLTENQPQSQEVELLQCPFCGGPGSMTEGRSAAVDARPFYNPACNACDYVFGVGFFYVEDAIRAWNTRADLPRATANDDYGSLLLMLSAMLGDEIKRFEAEDPDFDGSDLAGVCAAFVKSYRELQALSERR